MEEGNDVLLEHKSEQGTPPDFWDDDDIMKWSDSKPDLSIPPYITMDNTIIQWNCRGLRRNYNESLLLLTKFAPTVVCLQETFLKQADNALFKYYTTYSYSLVDNDTGVFSISADIPDFYMHIFIYQFYFDEINLFNIYFYQNF